jgi:hypothetical protein
MFLDKLWLRIRGELLTLKEDFSSGDDLRERAANLLEKLEHRISGEDIDYRATGSGVDSGHSQRGAHTVGRSDPPSLEDLEKEWDDLKKQRDASSADSEESGPPPPNPRELG